MGHLGGAQRCLKGRASWDFQRGGWGLEGPYSMERGEAAKCCLFGQRRATSKNVPKKK